MTRNFIVDAAAALMTAKSPIKTLIDPAAFHAMGSTQSFAALSTNGSHAQKWPLQSNYGQTGSLQAAKRKSSFELV